MKLSILYTGVVLLVVGLSTADAAWIPNIKFYSNKLVDAWDNDSYSDDINDYPSEEDILLSQDDSYHDVANWRPRQLDFYYRHMKDLLQNGLDPKKGVLSKTLGGVGFITGYDFNVAPSFYEGYYTRVDSYSVKPSFNMQKTLVTKKDYLLKAKLTPGYELEYTFYRHFKDPQIALSKRPYFHQNLPFDSDHTKKGMRAGDIFRFKARLTMNLDTSMISKLLAGSTGLSAGAFVELAGLFDVFIIRHVDNVAQLRIVGGKQHKIGIKGEAGLNLPFIDDSGLISLEKVLNKGLIFDYLVNLDDSKTQRAFDEALLKIREFEYMGMVDVRDPFGKKFNNDLMLNLLPLENLIHEGSTNVVSQFKGSDHAVGSDFKIGLGMNSSLLSIKHHGRKIENNFEHENENYVLNTKRIENSFSFLFSLSEIQTISRTSSLSTKLDGEIKPLAIVFASERTDRHFSSSDLKKSLKNIKRLFPYAYPKLDLTPFENQKLGAMGVRTIGVFTSEAVKALPTLSKEDILLKLKGHLSRLDVRDLIYQGNSSAASREESFQRRLSRISLKLEKVMNRKTKLVERMEALATLSNDRIFKATGMGFLVSLLSNEDRKLTRTEIVLNSNLGLKLSYIEGVKGPRGLYTQLLQYDDLLNGQELELRLLLDSLVQEIDSDFP